MTPDFFQSPPHSIEMEQSILVKLIKCQMVLYILVCNIALAVLGFITILIYQRRQKKRREKVGVKKEPKKFKKVDEAKMANKKWQTVYTRSKGHR